MGESCQGPNYGYRWLLYGSVVSVLATIPAGPARSSFHTLVYHTGNEFEGSPKASVCKRSAQQVDPTLRATLAFCLPGWP